MNKFERNSNYTNQTFEDIKHIDEYGIVLSKMEVYYEKI